MTKQTKAERKAAAKAKAEAATLTPAEASAVAQVNTDAQASASDNAPEPEQSKSVEEKPISHQPQPTVSNRNTSNLLARIAEWGLRAQDVMEEFHKLAFEVLETVKETRNATPAMHLQNAMPKGLRKRAFAVWLRTYSPINLTKEDEKTGNFTECSLHKPGDKFFRDFDLDGAKANPFGEDKEEVKALDPSNWSMSKDMVNKMTGLAKSILGEGKRKLGIPLADAKRKLGNLLGDYHALVQGKRAGPIEDKTMALINRARAYTPQPTEAATATPETAKAA